MKEPTLFDIEKDALSDYRKIGCVTTAGHLFKVANEEQQIIEGYASTNDLDEMDDIIEPGAYAASLPAYMQFPGVMLNHDYGNSIGKTLDARIDNKGLWVSIQISKAEPDIWTKIKEGIYSAFSVSGQIIKQTYDAAREIRTINDLRLYEISVVWLPANRSARIQVARSLASALGKGEVTLPLITQKEGITMPPEVDALVKTEVSAQVSAMKGEIKEHMGNVAISAAREHVEAKYMPLKQAVDEFQKQMEVVKASTGTFISESEFATFRDKIAKDMEPLIALLQASDGGTTSLPYLIEVDSIKDIFSNPVSPDGYREAQELGTSPFIMRMQLTDPMSLQGATQELMKRFQVQAQRVAVLHAILRGTEAYKNRGGIKSLRSYKSLFQTFETICKAAGMDTATAGEGLEWVPTLMSGDLIRRIELEATVARQFRRQSMPSKVWDWPIVGAQAVAFTMPEVLTYVDPPPSTLTATVAGTTKATFTAKKLGVLIPVSGELIEDSIIPALSIITDEIVIATVRGLDNAVVNGDTTNVGVAAANQDTDITVAYAQEKLLNGLRKKALAGTTVAGGGATITEAMLRSARKGLSGARTVTPSDLFYLVSTKSYVNMMALTNVLTLDKFGPLATILTGVLAAFDGVPIVVSDFVRENVSLTGVNGASGNTLTTVMIVHKPSWALGDRRQVTVKSQEVIINDSVNVVSTWRGDFVNLLTTTPAVIVINVLP